MRKLKTISHIAGVELLVQYQPLYKMSGIENKIENNRSLATSKTAEVLPTSVQMR